MRGENSGEGRLTSSPGLAKSSELNSSLPSAAATALCVAWLLSYSVEKRSAKGTSKSRTTWVRWNKFRCKISDFQDFPSILEMKSDDG